MYQSFHQHCLRRFGCKVYKLSLDAGCTCPNRDGTIGYGGCIFCTGSGEFAQEPASTVTQQLLLARRRVAHKNPDGKYMAYFQSFTNTYGPLAVLEAKFTEVILQEDIVALSIGTRPDCLGDKVLAMLDRLNHIKPVYVELGLQTVHPDSVRYIRRGYENAIYTEAVAQLRAIGIHVVTHIILGLPGETAQMAAETTRQAVAAGTDGVKFHLLHVLKGTDLAKEYAKEAFSCLTMEEYCQWLKLCLHNVPDSVVVHRITGDGAKKDLIAPLWSADKKRVLNYLNKALKEGKTD